MNFATDISNTLATAASFAFLFAICGYLIAVFATYDDNRMAGVYASGLLASALVFAGGAVMSTGQLTTVALIAGSVLLSVGALMLVAMTVVAAMFANRALRAAFA